MNRTISWAPLFDQSPVSTRRSMISGARRPARACCVRPLCSTRCARSLLPLMARLSRGPGIPAVLDRESPRSREPDGWPGTLRTVSRAVVAASRSRRTPEDPTGRNLPKATQPSISPGGAAQTRQATSSRGGVPRTSSRSITWPGRGSHAHAYPSAASGRSRGPGDPNVGNGQSSGGYRVVDTDNPGWRECREHVETSDEVPVGSTPAPLR